MEVLTMENLTDRVDNQQQLIRLANKLSNKDMCELINIFSERIMVFNIKHKSLDNITTNEDWEAVCINGAAIQINVDG
jgi:hypothetical protein